MAQHVDDGRSVAIRQVQGGNCLEGGLKRRVRVKQARSVKLEFTSSLNRRLKYEERRLRIDLCALIHSSSQSIVRSDMLALSKSLRRTVSAHEDEEYVGGNCYTFGAEPARPCRPSMAYWTCGEQDNVEEVMLKEW